MVFAQASPIIARMTGYRGYEPQHCLEQPNRYLLLVNGDSGGAYSTINLPKP